MKEKFQMLWVGGEEADVNIEIDFYDLITKSITNNVPLILDVSDVLDQVWVFLSPPRDLRS
ncbi:MAG: hypothetical protein Q7J35_05040 [Candidatus Methanoperedens sp.]|nr:hypothetical protein [Candidatus Methanoperedens sp.]